MASTPKFYIQPRRGKIALWVESPEAGRWCIWDLPQETCTEEVKQAIRRAFELGAKFYREALVTATRDALYVPTLAQWGRRDEEWR